MDTETNTRINKNAKLGWTLAGVFALTIVVLLFSIVREPKTYDWSTVRDQIRADCGSTEEADRQRCANALEELSGILEGLAVPAAQ